MMKRTIFYWRGNWYHTDKLVSTITVPMVGDYIHFGLSDISKNEVREWGISFEFTDIGHKITAIENMRKPG